MKKSIDDQTVQLRDEKLKADQAKTVLENPVFKAASESVTKKTDEKLFVIYGGAFHGEPEPPEERAEFSFAA